MNTCEQCQHSQMNLRRQAICQQPEHAGIWLVGIHDCKEFKQIEPEEPARLTW